MEVVEEDVTFGVFPVLGVDLCGTLRSAWKRIAGHRGKKYQVVEECQQTCCYKSPFGTSSTAEERIDATRASASLYLLATNPGEKDGTSKD